MTSRAPETLAFGFENGVQEQDPAYDVLDVTFFLGLMRKLLEQITDPAHWGASLLAIHTARYHLLRNREDLRIGETLRLMLRSPDGEIEHFDARVTRVTPGKGAALEVYPAGLGPWETDEDAEAPREAHIETPEAGNPSTPQEAKAATKAATANDTPHADPRPSEDDGSAKGKAKAPPQARTRTLHTRIQSLSAQEKMKLAMTADRTERAIPIRDQLKQIHPYVLRNPYIRQEEVGEYAKYAGLAPAAIKFIAEQLRWMQSPTLRFTLIRNPQIPREVAASIADGLNLNQLRWLMKHSGVRPDIRQVARRILERRKKI